MLTRLIVDVYAWIIEIYLWLVVLIAGVAGYHYGSNLFGTFGLYLEPHLIGKLTGALICALAGLLVSSVVMGPILVVFDIRKSIKSFEMKEGSFSEFVHRTERREPSLRDDARQS